MAEADSNISRFAGYVERVSLDRAKVTSFDAYPYSIPAIRHLESLDLHPAVTFFVGENGTGKSTILEALAVAAGFNAEGGGSNFSFETRPSHSELWEHIRLLRGPYRPKDTYFLRAESFFNVASEIDYLATVTPWAPRQLYQSYGGKSLHERSHGEAFLALLQHRFRGQGLYLLDEPEAALSPTRQMSVLALMHSLVRRQSQLIIATHSPILMAYPHGRIYLLTDDAIAETRYAETEHYQVTLDFLSRHERMMDVLLEGDT